MHKIGKSGGFLGKLIGPLLKTGFPLMINILKLLATRVLVSLGLATVASAIDAVFHKKKFGSGNKTLVMTNKEINDAMKKCKSNEESALLIK